jgi:hypothetical protein
MGDARLLAVRRAREVQRAGTLESFFRNRWHVGCTADVSLTLEISMRFAALVVEGA